MEEEGPFRVPQPGERRGAVRQAEPAEPTPPLSRQPEETPVVRAEPERASRRPAAPVSVKEEKRRSKNPLLFVVAILIIIVLVLGAILLFQKLQSGNNNATAIDSSKYQAVFLTNGQVYFGKLQSFNSNYMTLTDIFYLQTQSDSTDSSSNPQETSSDQSSDVQLIKLGNEIHGPEDEMVITKDQMLFYENLKPTGKVSESIAKYNAAAK